jgi:NADH-ubiquinone oxidoreductase chain 3
MSSSTIFFYFVPLITILLLVLNLIFAKHNPYLEKDSPFECGYHSFLGQSRTQFTISFFIFGLLFLLFDLEILLVFPYGVSAFTNETMGLIIFIIFFVLLTIGFIFEIGKGALSISSKQNVSYSSSTVTYNWLNNN